MSEETEQIESFNVKRVKTPVVIQMEAVECGAAALGMILGYYGKFVPLEELRVQCGVSRDGSKAINMVKAARLYGLEAKGFTKQVQGLRDLPTPYIVFWQFNHFLVVEGFHNDKVYLNDPASGRRVISFSEFDDSFTGVVLTFEPTEAFKASGKPPGITGAVMSRLQENKIALIFLVLTGLALVIPNLLVPIFSKIFIDKYLVANLKSWVLPLLIGMGLTALLRSIILWIQEFYLLKLETKLAVTLSSKLFWRILQLPIIFFMQRTPGELSNRINLNDDIAMALSRDVMTSLLAVMLIGFYLALMIFYDQTLTVIAVISAALTVGLSQYLNVRQKTVSQSLIADQSKYIGKSMDGLLVIETLKASGRESDFYSHWSGYQANYLNQLQSISWFSYVIAAVPTLLNGLTSALILGIGGLHVINGTLTIGMLVAFQSLSASFIAPVNNLVGSFSKFNVLFGSIMRVDDVMNHKVAPNVEIIAQLDTDSEKPPEPKLNGFLELRHLRFGYSPLEDELITDFSLKLTPGQRVALIGSSGSGKSTIARLVMGFYEIWDGEILLDDTNINALPRAVVTNSMAMVDQNVCLFEASIKDNITLWDSTIPEHTMIQAAKDANIHHDIMARDGGYNSIVSEGGRNFSGGQRQRLEIARTLAIDPSILILDEATSALDPITELHVNQAIRRRGCTTLVVAHRLSTIRDADEIIVLDAGNIVQRGNHETLYKQTGPYADLLSYES